MDLPTLKIANPKGEGFVTINESDFDPAKHTLWGDGAAPKPKAAPAPTFDLANATKAQMAEFAKREFNIELDPAKLKVDDMRAAIGDELAKRLTN